MIILGRGQVEISDSAFEDLRRAVYLMGKARETGRSDEDAAYLLDQADKAMNRGRLDVVVPPPEKTPAPTKLTEEYKQLAVSVAVDQSRIEHYGTSRKPLDERRRDLVEKKAKIEVEMKALPPETKEKDTPPKKEDTSKSKKSDLLKQLEALNKDLSKTEADLKDLSEKEKAAEKILAEDEGKLNDFVKKNPDVGPREPKKR